MTVLVLVVKVLYARNPISPRQSETVKSLYVELQIELRFWPKLITWGN